MGGSKKNGVGGEGGGKRMLGFRSKAQSTVTQEALMFIVTYRDFWKALDQVRGNRGYSTYRNMLKQLLDICAFGNLGVEIPDAYRLKR